MWFGSSSTKKILTSRNYLILSIKVFLLFLSLSFTRTMFILYLSVFFLSFYSYVYIQCNSIHRLIISYLSSVHLLSPDTSRFRGNTASMLEHISAEPLQACRTVCVFNVSISSAWSQPDSLSDADAPSVSPLCVLLSYVRPLFFLSDLQPSVFDVFLAFECIQTQIFSSNYTII